MSKMKVCLVTALMDMSTQGPGLQMRSATLPQQRAGCPGLCWL